jgi:mRNA-degrading endonuclease RelE of RelBE toxin-antitoxin system
MCQGICGIRTYYKDAPEEGEILPVLTNLTGQLLEFRIADTFTDSLARLTGEEQKAVKTTAFDLQLNPANPGMSFHKLDKAKDKNFWSVRVSSDIRLIVHRSSRNLLLCFVGHHDKAYEWAERRKLETHPKTGAAQLVELRETVKEIVVPAYVQAEATGAPKSVGEPSLLFAGTSDDALLAHGVPTEWLDDVKNATEDGLLALADHLPAEAAEALLELATAGTPRMGQVLEQPAPAFSRDRQAATPFPRGTISGQRSFEEALGPVEIPSGVLPDSFTHPDAQRRFRTITSVEELQRALDFPWDKWTVFLHPDQRDMVERDYAGPARVSGSAGTGKTIVVLHRATQLARSHPNSRVLLTTFSDTLANALRTKLKRLLATSRVSRNESTCIRSTPLGFGFTRRMSGRRALRMAKP